MKYKNASHWFVATLAAFVVCIGMQGCSQIATNPAAVTSTNIDAQWQALDQAEVALNFAPVTNHWMTPSAAENAQKNLSDAIAALHAATVAYDAGNTSLANTYYTEAKTLAASVGVIPTTAPTTAP